MKIIDRYGRPVKGVRISLTPSYKCNFRCVFCHMEGVVDQEEIFMNPGEIERIVRILYKYGVDKVKLTGGEPMLRSDILEIVERLGRIGLSDLAMTTNGTRLVSLAKKLRKSGLMRVNISLHTLDEKKYCWITGLPWKSSKTRYEYTVDAIRSAVEAGLNPVKLNVVVMRGVNDDEIDRMIDFAGSFNGKVILQLIELVEEGLVDRSFFQKYHYNLKDLEDRFEKEALKTITRSLHRRKQYMLPNGVWVEVVRPLSGPHFCMSDDRIRITHDGKFKPCLMTDENLVDFLTPMRMGVDDGEIERLFIEAIKLREPYYKPGNLKPRENVEIMK